MATVKPAQSPKALIVEARRAEAAAAAAEQELASARARGAGAAEIADLEARAEEARTAAAAQRKTHHAGLAAWDTYHAAEDAEREKAEDARRAEIERRVWPEGRP